MNVKETFKSIKFIRKIYYFFVSLKQKSRLDKYYQSDSYNKLISFHNKHYGEKCFIIGNGPSLTPEDLNLLKEEVTFATHRIYNIFDQTDWRPTYYMGQDFVLLNEIQNEVEHVEAKIKFFPINIKWFYKFDINDAIYFYLNSEEYHPNLPKFSTDASKQIYEGYSVTYGAIQLAVYMGFKEIYLLGVDFNYAVTVNNEGKIITNQGVKDYFSKDNNLGLKLPNLENSLLGFQAARKFADENGLVIRNATRGGKLEVFDRIKLEDVLLTK
ncbi:6-hydroxymethylpterin diphosphokinase MptE-like protein [Bacillus sp. S/N-304-OC-R1]|uniref:6-hydroxymethylpterin diphosphokinase MptE-like protein n=1 Tax=Bacillus sp. S/N-304-OC-R1 TaxID=2758034 RepID=UPI001C8DA0E6|nr:6-hydroxymethylpterin diphosphokinase MptE-like protein [Bacillus sp. S/N-304-OC-R1]MBY0124246.1 DUF115 domain-containing protein [Bacillus sp. S/N-304-OC-R1]